MTGLGLVGWVLAALVTVVLFVFLFFNIRAHKLASQVGAFRCHLREEDDEQWAVGIGRYGVETLAWYRLTGTNLRPDIVFPRRNLEVSPACSADGDERLVEVRLSTDTGNWRLALDPQTYNGLVSWVESGPPHHRGL